MSDDCPLGESPPVADETTIFDRFDQTTTQLSKPRENAEKAF